MFPRARVSTAAVTIALGCATAAPVAEPPAVQNVGAGEKVIQTAAGSVSAVFPEKNWQVVERLPHSLKLEPNGTPLSLAASARYLGPEEEKQSVLELLKGELDRDLTPKIQWSLTEQGEALLGGRPAVRVQAQAVIGQATVLLMMIGRRVGQRICMLQLTGLPTMLGTGVPVFDRAADTFRCTPPKNDAPPPKASAASLAAEAEKSIEALDPTRGVALFERAVLADPSKPDLMEKLVQASLLVGDSTRALRVLKSELARDPQRFEHWKILAQLQYQLGDSDAGLATLKAAVARPGAPASLYAALGEGYLRSEAYADAEAVFRTAIGKDPKDGSLHAALGEAYLREEKYGPAEKEIGEAIRIDPMRAEYHAALSEVFGATKQDEKAARESMEALERGVPKTLDATLKYNLACYNARMGRERECLYWLRQAFEAGFNDVDFMRKDPDLASVRDLPAFKELFQK
jgi:tetratricopeptide (TPR) repeat protein